MTQDSRRRRRRTRNVAQALGRALLRADRAPRSSAQPLDRRRLSPLAASTSGCRRPGRWRCGAPACSRSTRASEIESGLDAVGDATRCRRTAGRVRRRRPHDDRPAAARGGRRRRVEAAHRTEPQRPGRDRDAAVGMDACSQLDAAIRELQHVMLDQACETLAGRRSCRRTRTCSARSPCPARTGCCRTSGRSTAIAQRLARVARSAAVLPLGSGAVAGCAFPGLARAAPGEPRLRRCLAEQHRRGRPTATSSPRCCSRSRCSARTCRGSPRT